MVTTRSSTYNGRPDIIGITSPPLGFHADDIRTRFDNATPLTGSELYTYAVRRGEPTEVARSASDPIISTLYNIFINSTSPCVFRKSGIVELRDLFDRSWNHRERNRFLNDDTKTATDDFDPESFKHEGFDDREKYLETFVPALADPERLDAELTDFTPPRLKKMNNSPYQALVLRYGVLQTLIKQHDFYMEKGALLDAVKSWQKDVIDRFEAGDFSNDDLLHLAKAAIDYQNDIDDSELHMVSAYLQIRNQDIRWKHRHATWLDFFHRLASIDRFPKVSRSERPSHAIDTIKQGIWSLQEQAVLYEVADSDEGSIVGIPEDYVDHIRKWLYYEMSRENYLRMLEELDPFDHQDLLIEARELFGVDSPTGGRNDRRRESLVDAGVFPSDLLREVLSKDDLKLVVDEYSLDANKRYTDEMIEATIAYFEQSQTLVEDDEPTAELFLKCYDDIADGNVDRVPPQLQKVVDRGGPSDKLEILFERATAEIFKEIFNLSGTTLLGQSASGTVADGEIEQDENWLLWDNKRRVGPFKLGASTRATMKSYIDRKNQQHDVRWFVIIAPVFAESAADDALKLEMQTGVNIRLLRAEDLQRLANIWLGKFAGDGRALPLSIFNGAGRLNLGIVEETLDAQFS